MFEHGATVVRERRKLLDDPYSTAQTPGPWSDVDALTIEGAYVAQSSSDDVRTPTRARTDTRVALYCDPDSDVAAGDRIRVGAEIFYVNAVPANHFNPFTGWNPMQEVPLERSEG